MTEAIPPSTEAKDNAPASFKGVMYLMGAVAFLSLVGPHLFFWLWRTAVLQGGQPVKDELWSQYGDFIGGIANPVISLLTFAGLLYTILVQRQELALQRRELKNSSEALRATKEELRQTKEIAAEQAAFYRIESRKSDIEKALVLISTDLDAALQHRWHPERNSVREDLIFKSNETIEQFKTQAGIPMYASTPHNVAITLLIRLSLYVSYYEKYDQDSALLFYYHMKYADVAVPIINTEMLDRRNFAALLNPRSP